MTTKEIHRAGPMVGMVQLCAHCGETLSDYRNSAWPEGQPAPTGWPVGANVEVVRGNPSQWWTTDEPPTCVFQPPDSIKGHSLL